MKIKCHLCNKNVENLEEHMETHHEDLDINHFEALLNKYVREYIDSSEEDKTMKFQKYLNYLEDKEKMKLEELFNPMKDEFVKIDNHRNTYATRINPKFSEFDIRFDICNERILHRNGREVVLIEHTIISTPTAAKRLLSELKECIEEYEEHHGEIRSDTGSRRPF